MNSPPTVLLLLYFAASLILGIGGWFYRRRLGPRELRRWVPRLQLLWVVLTGGTLIALSVLIDLWPFAVLTLAVALYGIYYVTALARVCEACGTAVPSLTLGKPAQYCLKCGAALRRTSLFGE